MRPIDIARRSIPNAAPDCRHRSNPKQSVRMRARWKEIKKKLADYERLIKTAIK